MSDLPRGPAYIWDELSLPSDHCPEWERPPIEDWGEFPWAKYPDQRHPTDCQRLAPQDLQIPKKSDQTDHRWDCHAQPLCGNLLSRGTAKLSPRRRLGWIEPFGEIVEACQADQAHAHTALVLCRATLRNKCSEFHLGGKGEDYTDHGHPRSEDQDLSLASGEQEIRSGSADGGAGCRGAT